MPFTELSDKKRAWHILQGYEIREDSYRRIWYMNGKRHREDGPTFERADGLRIWNLDGKFHREEGPAIEWSDGSVSWFLNNKKMTEEEHQIAIQKLR